MKTQDLPHRQTSAEWSNRILLLALIGIAYLTLFPFRFDFAPSLIFHKYPFLLGTSAKHVYFLDVFLNVLLFVPFGFGLSAQMRKRRGGRWTSLLLALAVGAGVSYLVELLQFYIPERDSGWEDVFSNALGSVAGFFLFELCGGPVLEELSKWEDALEGWLSPRRAASLLVAYFAVCFGISVRLQYETRLSNWDPQCIFFVGNDASGQNPWKGQVFRLHIWNRALSEQAIRRIAARESVDDSASGLIGSYDFASSSPYHDQEHLLPVLGWTPIQPQFRHVRATDLDGKSWLSTEVPVENLTREIKKSNQFTVHVVCAPAATEDSNGVIVALSQSDDNLNFLLRQQGTDLVFWFRNPLSETRSALAWYVPGVFESGTTRDIVASYDGSDSFIYLDGNRIPGIYRLSPGASFMHSFSFIRTSTLEGSILVYETLIFLPAGLLIGLEMKKWFTQKASGRWLLALGWILPAVLLEILLAGVSGRRIWLGNIAFSLIFGLAGMLLINADRRFQNSAAS